MKTIPFIFFIIFSSSLISGTLSRKLFVVQDDRAGNGNDGGSGGDSLQCIQQLMPCRPYLKESNPPATCCIPLKQAVADEPQCLCRVFQNQDLMRSFNITLEDAMALAESCGARADLSVCKKVSAPSNSPAIPSRQSSPKGSSYPPAKVFPTSDIAELAPRLGAYMVTLITIVVSLYQDFGFSFLLLTGSCYYY